MTSPLTSPLGDCVPAPVGCPTPLSPRRRQILDAAVSIIASQGLRGLTHRAVDRAAGLPQGSTSAYLRTRQALQRALAQHVASQLGADVERVVEQVSHLPDGDPRTMAAVMQMIVRWLEARDLVLARVELTLEAARDADVAAAMSEHHERLIELVTTVLAQHDHEAPRVRAEVMVASLDGIVLAALLQHGEQRADFVGASLALLLPPATGWPRGDDAPH